MFSRTQGIGGSDVAAILGLSPFRSEFDVWLEKTGDPAHEPQAETPQMRFGRLMEPVLAKVYEEDHPGATVSLMGGHDTPPIWTPGHVVYAHIDGTVSGEGIWEGKTAFDDRDWRTADGYRLPEYYEAQVRTYLAATGEPWCDVTVFFRQQSTFAHIRVEADPEIDAGVIKVAEEWWERHVVGGLQPAIDGSPGASAYLIRRYPAQVREEDIHASVDVDAAGAHLASVRAHSESLERTRTALENAIKEEMGEHGRIVGSNWSATWRRSRGRTTTAWQEVAAAYRGLLHQVGSALARDDAAEALRLLTDNPVDGILALYTRESDGTRPFVFRSAEKG